MPNGGCHGMKEWVVGHETDVCPVMWINEYSSAFDAYLWSDKGMLPFRGGWADQPAMLMQCVDIISAEHNKAMKERTKTCKAQ